jgi:thiamine kinase-like enzyme
MQGANRTGLFWANKKEAIVEKMSVVSSPLDSSNITEIPSITSKIPSDILAFFPDAQEAKLLKGGDVNQCYCIKTSKETFAFRLGIADPGRYGFNRDEELTFYQEGERLGVSPPLRSSDPPKGILVMQYINGNLIDKQIIRAAGVLPKVITLVQALHKIECPKSGEGKTIEHIRFFMNKLKEHHSLPADWEKLINNAISKMPLSKLVLCHNDLAFNLLEDRIDSRVWAIDFECAGWNNPAFDLAFLCIWYEFTEEEKELILKTYTDKKISMPELNSAICLGLLFSALWSKLEVIYGDDSYQQKANELYQKALIMSGFMHN